MTNLSDEFACFLSNSKAVKFGNFTLKSGKESNIFIDFGEIYYGRELMEIGSFFAEFIVDNSLQNVDVLFGPAYKGINISIATSIALSQKYNLSIPFTYNRKTTKDHGEKGNFVGFDLSQAKSAIILDDVFTDGGAKYDSIELLSGFEGLRLKAIVVGVDRQERDGNGASYISLFKQKTNIDVLSITTKAKLLCRQS